MLLKYETGKGWTTYRDVPLEHADWIQLTAHKNYVTLAFLPGVPDRPTHYAINHETAKRVLQYLERRQAAGLEYVPYWTTLEEDDDIDEAHTIDTKGD